MVKIKGKDGDAIYVSYPSETLEGAIAEATELGLALHNADFAGQDFGDIDLEEANLSGSSFRGSTLTDAMLCGCDLTSADFSEARISGTFIGCDFRGADFSGATFGAAMFENCRLDDGIRAADLSLIRADLMDVLVAGGADVPGLREALVQGRIRGNLYRGECCCLMGTLANLRGVDVKDDDIDMPTRRRDADSPAESWFYGIRKGDTPENNVLASLALEWIDRYLTSAALAA
jgi:uncharacterized protein YjbI with pentapeptide repeats